MSTAVRRLCVLLVLGLVAVLAGVAVLAARDDSRRHYLDSGGWPAHGQAAYAVNNGGVQASPHQRPVPIASLAKVMTAYLVLRTAEPDLRLVVTARDVADTSVRAGRDESIVRVEQGEQLTQLQALAALLLPSANNVAIMLARQVSGSVAAFVRAMNRAAARLGMHDTTYTDPSGFRADTRSTAADQLVLARVAMHNRVFAALVAMPSYPMPLVGTVHNTDRLLGKHGFVGIKTGSDDDAGGCFMFRTHRTIDGAPADLTGVVLGQPGRNLIMTGQYAALQLADLVSSTS
jgi:D-alanyl-D-alanine carboxypeptidase (penicillin-binding protein 5/6)